MANDEINVPSLVLVLVVSGLLIRHFFFRSSPPAAPGAGAGVSSSAAAGASSSRTGSGGGGGGDQRRADALHRRTEAAVDHFLEIFPTADRRAVWWDLRRNGVNMTATIERFQAGRLDPPPPSTRAAAAGGGRAPAAAAPAAAAAAAAAEAMAKQATARPPSLIQRYHLQDRVVPAPTEDKGKQPQRDAAEAAEATTTGARAGTSSKGKAWSANRDERQALLKKRRDDMILEARRKMEAKVAAEKAAAAAAAAGESL